MYQRGTDMEHCPVGCKTIRVASTEEGRVDYAECRAYADDTCPREEAEKQPDVYDELVGAIRREFADEKVAEICETCRYMAAITYHAYDASEGVVTGECYRNPPVFTRAYKGDTRAMFDRPSVFGDEYCGEWKERTNG